MLFQSTFLLALLSTSIASPIDSTASHWPKPPKTKYLITFGDSYSQTGFNVSLALPSPSNPLGNPDFPGWTTSGGPNWIGYLVSTFNTTSLLSYNFADGGATVSASLVAPYQPTVKSFIDQVSTFTASIAPHPKTTPWTGADSLFAIWLGVNDVGNANWYATDAPLWDDIIAAYLGQVDILYSAGGRNFAFLNVPPTQRAPAVLALDAAVIEHWGEVVAAFNSKLAEAAKVWAGGKSGVRVRVVDTQGPFNAALDNPTGYGANSTGATCWDADGTTCLWWNDYHPGMAIQRLVAKEVVRDWEGSFF